MIIKYSIDDEWGWSVAGVILKEKHWST
jgi:hypothetical protein